MTAIHRHCKRLPALLGTASLCALLAGAASAQENDVQPSRPTASRITLTALSGTLAKARASGTIALGYREASVPFSYLNTRNQPIGYSIELCKALVTSIEDVIKGSLAPMSILVAAILALVLFPDLTLAPIRLMGLY